MSAAGIVRPALVWHPGAGPEGLRRAIEWGAALQGCAPDDIAAGSVCVWSPGPPDAASSTIPDDVRRVACWHTFDVPEVLDVHATRLAPGRPWTPWGTKSGPNIQFFSLIERWADAHDHPWVLLVEPDTYPMPHDVVRSEIGRLLEAHPDAWVIGAPAHPTARAVLPQAIGRHLNGAALYRAGDANFIRFVRRVWMPSLFTVTRDDPVLAWDCLTDPSTSALLQTSLRTAWEQAQHRFVATAGMVNLSTHALDDAGLAAALAHPELVERLRLEGARPWQIHAKGRFTPSN
jgi:hypothetical protein